MCLAQSRCSEWISAWWMIRTGRIGGWREERSSRKKVLTLAGRRGHEAEITAASVSAGRMCPWAGCAHRARQQLHQKMTLIPGKERLCCFSGPYRHSSLHYSSPNTNKFQPQGLYTCYAFCLEFFPTLLYWFLLTLHHPLQGCHWPPCWKGGAPWLSGFVPHTLHGHSQDNKYTSSSVSTVAGAMNVRSTSVFRCLTALGSWQLLSKYLSGWWHCPKWYRDECDKKRAPPWTLLTSKPFFHSSYTAAPTVPWTL